MLVLGPYPVLDALLMEYVLALRLFDPHLRHKVLKAYAATLLPQLVLTLCELLAWH